MPPKLDTNCYSLELPGISSRLVYDTLTGSSSNAFTVSCSSNPLSLCDSCSDCENFKKKEPPKVNTDEIIRKAHKRKYTPKQIIYNPPATIVFWEDGTKTVVKCSESETYSEYYGFLAALGKKIFETNSEVNRIVKTYIPKPKEEPKMKPTDKSGKKSETFRKNAEKAKKETKKKEPKKK